MFPLYGNFGEVALYGVSLQDPYYGVLVQPEQVGALAVGTWRLLRMV